MKRRRESVLGAGDLGTSLLFIFPLWLAYDVGILFTPTMNGVDFVSRHLLHHLGRRGYLALHLALAATFLVALAVLRRRRAFDPSRFLPMFFEAGIYALTLGTLILVIMRALGLEPILAVGAVRSVVLSLGAGVHEELVFRLLLGAGGAAVLKRVGVSHGLAVVTAFGVSSVLFALAHHVGPYGDPLVPGVLVYRILAGALFAAIFYYRSLAHAVYAHAMYDVYVMVF